MKTTTHIFQLPGTVLGYLLTVSYLMLIATFFVGTITITIIQTRKLRLGIGSEFA